MTLNVQYDFRQAYCGSEELIGLKTRDARDGEKRVRLRDCDHVVGNGINAKVTLKVVLHDKWIAELCEIGDAVDIISKVRPVFQTDPVSSGGNILPRLICLIQVRI